MTARTKGWDESWSVGVRVWIARHGQAILGPGRAELLAEIDRSHSISSAARNLGMSYRRAWELVQAINESAGEPLTAAQTGGRRGGGATLTERGQFALRLYYELQADTRAAAAGSLSRHLAAPSAPSSIVHLAAAVSLQETVGELLAEFALLRPLVSVRAVFGASDELADQIVAGAPIDLFLSADQACVERLRTTALADREQCCVLASNGLATLAPAGSRLALGSPKHLLRADVGRIVLARPECPLGACTKAYLSQIGIYDQLLTKSQLVENSRSVVTLLRAGKADVGLAFASDASAVTDLMVAFKIPVAKAHTDYVAVRLKRATKNADVAALLEFLGSKPAKACFRRHGLAPTTARKRWIPNGSEL